MRGLSFVFMHRIPAVQHSANAVLASGLPVHVTSWDDADKKQLPAVPGCRAVHTVMRRVPAAAFAAGATTSAAADPTRPLATPTLTAAATTAKPTAAAAFTALTPAPTSGAAVAAAIAAVTATAVSLRRIMHAGARPARRVRLDHYAGVLRVPPAATTASPCRRLGRPALRDVRRRPLLVSGRGRVHPCQRRARRLVVRSAGAAMRVRPWRLVLPPARHQHEHCAAKLHALPRAGAAAVHRRRVQHRLPHSAARQLGHRRAHRLRCVRSAAPVLD